MKLQFQKNPKTSASRSDSRTTTRHRDTDGFKIKRECGLGPCNFNDVMASKGLGLDTCDRSRKEYFCLFCCRESGCNKGSSSDVSSSPSNYLLILGVVLFSILTLFNRFQPPYYPESL
ncbi:PREDICTED: uncharacterized protein LOC108560293 [Nicrophorus vespilloides]|uniref:Uncharacterized protein LOC108560293 n=1 Tax=Nicrophorus vespilloides TaxID=110193 RepID=A0ABM1MFF4_NICVS|nr:PREDICTED: uncharacterized protein LOC108560293 [Nicrophorus vespilloides]